MPFDPQAIISKLNIKLRTLTPTGPFLYKADSWVSQTPHTTAKALLQSVYIQRQIVNHQRSSLTNIFSAAIQLAKGAEAFAYLVTLLKEENETLWKANEALSKHWRAKHTRL